MSLKNKVKLGRCYDEQDVLEAVKELKERLSLYAEDYEKSGLFLSRRDIHVAVDVVFGK